MAKHLNFNPPWYLRHRSVQTIGASLNVRRKLLLRRGSAMLQNAQPRIVDTPEGIRLKAAISRQPNGAQHPWVFLLHGWEGCMNSNYLVCSADRLYREGYNIVRLNFRDHGDTHALNRGIFHSARLAEVRDAINVLLSELAPSRAYLVGFSLGGNFALRLARICDSLAQRFVHTIAICPAIDPQSAMHNMDNSTWLYRQYFVDKWQKSLAIKQKLFPDLYDFSPALKMRTLQAMTEYLIPRYSEFATAEEYLDAYSVAGDRLARLKTPATIISAADDPVLRISDVEQLPSSENLHIVCTRYGGHCGYFDQFSIHSWAEDAILHLIQTSDNEQTAS